MNNKKRIVRNYDAILKREKSTETQTLGEFAFFQDRVKLVFSCKTIELEVDCNAVRDDAIPKGVYKVVKRYSEKYRWHFHIKDVPNRSYILIHNANYSRQLLGCVAVGASHVDIDRDGLIDVTSSKSTLKRMNKILPDEFILKIQ
jgi:hypothetical protein